MRALLAAHPEIASEHSVVCHEWEARVTEKDCAETGERTVRDFLKRVEQEIAGWIATEAEQKRKLRGAALAEAWTVQLLAERLRQATLTPDTLANCLEMSAHVLRERLSKSGARFTVGDMILYARLQLAAELLVNRLASTSIIDIAHACGWDDPRRFAVCFKALWGMTPKEFQVRRKAAASSDE